MDRSRNRRGPANSLGLRDRALPASLRFLGARDSQLVSALFCFFSCGIERSASYFLDAGVANHLGNCEFEIAKGVTAAFAESSLSLVKWSGEVQPISMPELAITLGHRELRSPRGLCVLLADWGDSLHPFRMMEFAITLENRELRSPRGHSARVAAAKMPHRT
jgi:hypothetical protein